MEKQKENKLLRGVNPDAWKDLKIIAAANGQTIGQAIEFLVTEHLKRKKKLEAMEYLKTLDDEK